MDKTDFSAFGQYIPGFDFLQSLARQASGVKPDLQPAAGGAVEPIQADYVLVANGRRPYTAGLGLAEACIELMRQSNRTHGHVNCHLDDQVDDLAPLLAQAQETTHALAQALLDNPLAEVVVDVLRTRLAGGELAMRCAHHACEAGIAEMERATREGVPLGGMSEDDIWSELHKANIKRGGEWIETRLLASGPRTNPWFQECGPRLVQNNEIVAFDTDLIGAYGFCIDISRTWWVGDQRPSNAMVSAFHHGLDHIRDHQARLKPGVSIKELVFGGHKLDDIYWKQKYSCKMHGVGLCDEWPYVTYPDSWMDGAFDAVLEPGMTICVEALVSPEGGDFSIKLEDQVLITDTGCENLTRYPFDAALMGQS